jgi:hypothetical protein
MPAELDAAQRNVLPHDVLRNDRSVDDALWNGSPAPTGVMKAGFIVFGTFFFLGGVAIASEITRSHIAAIPALLFLIAGTKIFSNAFRRRTK